ncbi:hypothetical protein JCGZ_21624 [Jatropha curcas]|uniref:non-specific serine/threonine protein kinase n=1 Tax=Jatropha curcas TaxID=180498 RepID=A0A067JEF8_JATCU|nr:hypothetical protein JCGZ_21624 [Jatropha curcas]
MLERPLSNNLDQQILRGILLAIVNFRTTPATLLPCSDFAYNYMNGSIPREWASMQLKSISLLANRSSVNIPSYLENFNSLIYLNLELNQFSGTVPQELAKMVNLKSLILSSNKLIGSLPAELAELRNLTNFRINDNSLNGSIPHFIQNWRNLKRLRIGDINATNQAFPDLCSIKGLTRLVLRSCNVSGEIPPYIWQMNRMRILERSFLQQLDKEKAHQPACQRKDLSLNLFRSSSMGNDMREFLHFLFMFLVEEGVPPLRTRLSPISLTYYRRCLKNENHTVSLHFAEIQFTNGNTYNSLGNRIFDIFIENDRVERDFNIEVEANGVAKPIVKKYNATVTNNILEIRFFWAGKGTTRIPLSGVYGPLISAISVDPKFDIPSEGGDTKVAPIVIGVIGSCLILLALDLEGVESQTVSFTLKLIKAATKNFDPSNKIGEGGFGPVYKGLLADGTVIAVKQLSSKSSQGNREFLNEIGMISCLQHPNLVKLLGCCMQGNQLLLVYEYMENNCLAHALLGPENCQMKLDWQTRQRICVGIARGLYFLHEESRLKIVHRDIKATNVLLDKNLNPKISDFGLAKLDTEENKHISTRIAGTIFGIVALEIVSGKHNRSYGPDNDFACLLDWACHLQQNGNLIELVDEKLGSDFKKVEAERMIKVALLCTNGSPSLRPGMSEVVNRLEGATAITDVISEASSYNEDLRFKAIRENRKQIIESSSGNHNQDFSSASGYDLYDIKARKDNKQTDS